MLAVTLILFALVIAAFTVSLLVGARAISLPEILSGLLGRTGSADALVIASQRLPRTVIGLATGLALGAAGALMQGHTRNPLAEPGLFGVNAGAALGVAALVYLFGVDAPLALPVAALLGAAIATALIFLLGLGQLRGAALVMLAVIGTTVSQLLGSFTSALVLLDKQTLDTLRFWQVGSLQNRDVQLLWLLLVLVSAGLVLALVNSFAVNSLSLGEDTARALGTRVASARVTGIVAITLLAGAATALCGPIAFVGLVAPHLARLFSGHDYRWLIPQAALAGAALLLSADTLGRVMAPPGELQAGVVMALLGGPVLVAITRRRRLVAL
ncbi:FecCD family ABC transporter permease [Micropruina sp.]|uniref:FecCD family ABC transporter permease n=1 Tax=Micropruina sp. TaxID=2737536 RepID=UPI0039E3FFD2